MDRPRPFVVQVRTITGDGAVVRAAELRWEVPPTAAEVLGELCHQAAAAHRRGEQLVVVAPPELLVLLRAAGLLRPTGPLSTG